MAVVPYYNKPPQEGLYRHFRTIAESVDVPVILYNIPGRCVINMTADDDPAPRPRRARTSSRSSRRTGDLSQIAAIIDGAPDGFEVLSGDDELTRCR